MTVMATTQQPLNVRIEQLIRKAMNRNLRASSTRNLARAVKDAIWEVAVNVQDEARGKGWTQDEINGLRAYTARTGAIFAAELVQRRCMTREEWLAA